MCKLRTIDGMPLRPTYQENEANAIKHIHESGLQSGQRHEEVSANGTRQWYKVMVNDDSKIIIERESNGRIIEAAKMESVPRKERTKREESKQENKLPEETEETNNNNSNDMETKTNDLAAQMAQAISGILAKQLEENNNNNASKDDINKIIDERIKEIQEAHTTKIQVNNSEPKKIDSVLHAAFNEVFMWCSNHEPVYLYGAAGTGKNVLAKQVAEAMELPFYYCGALQQKYELEGFINAAGEYQETDFYKAFTGGGVFLFDEIDGTAAEVLVAFNAALANRYYNFPKFGRIEAHKDFIVIAAGNTSGRGADDAYNGRFQLDASTLDRFVFVKLDYDRRIEMECANNDNDLVDFAHSLRNEIENQRLTYTVSTRAIRRLVISLNCGFDEKQAMKQSVCGGWDANDIRLLQANLFNTENKYVSIFKSL